MGTLVLRSRDPFPCNPNPRHRSRRRRKSPPAARGTPVPETASSPPGKNLVMGQVRILKRGENLKLGQRPVSGSGRRDFALSSADWIGPDPEVVRQHVRVSDLYAGAACLPSPPPSSLPFPAALVRGAAASDLRRFLKI